MQSTHFRALPLLLLLSACDHDPQAPADSAATVFLFEVSGNAQTGQTGVPLEPFSIVVQDRDRQPVAGASVFWEVVAGNGTVHPAVAITGDDGVASAVLTPAAGFSRVAARPSRGSEIGVQFTAFACPHPCSSWSTTSRLPHARAWHGALVQEGRVWLLGGVREPHRSAVPDVTVVDPESGSWQPVEPMPVSRSGGVAAAVDGKIYYIGGYDTYEYMVRGLTSVLAFDPAAAEWTPRSGMALGRAHAAGEAIDGRIYVVGGYEYCDTFEVWCAPPTSGLEIYHPATDRWTEGAAMTTGRAQAGTAVVDGKLVVAGGSDCALPAWSRYTLCGAPIASVEVYDPVADRWSARAPLPMAGATRLAVLNGRLYAMVSTFADQLSTIYEYDAAADAWSPMVVAPFRTGAVLVALDGQLYVVGGENGFVRQQDVMFYDDVLTIQR